MYGSFADRLDVFCRDFASVVKAVGKRPLLNEDEARDILTQLPDEDLFEFALRCQGTMAAYNYLMENWEGFCNVGLAQDTPDGGGNIEGHLLFALCLSIATADEPLGVKPNLEDVIDTALQGPF